jgi:hypothetical protein
MKAHLLPLVNLLINIQNGVVIHGLERGQVVNIYYSHGTDSRSSLCWE